MNTRDMSPGDRRELRSLVKKQFAVLRNDVKRREKELQGEIEAALLRKYRAQDQRIAETHEAMRRAMSDYALALEKIADDLRTDCPDLNVQYQRDSFRGPTIGIADDNKQQERRALLAAIPQQISDASTQLDQKELDLLRDLTVGALDSEQAKTFLQQIPTVGQLVPKARLAAIEGDVS